MATKELPGFKEQKNHKTFPEDISLQFCSLQSTVLKAELHLQFYFKQTFCSDLVWWRLYFDLRRNGLQSEERLGLGCGPNILFLQSDFR